MSKNTPTSLQARLAFESAAILVRVLLHCCVMFVAVLFPCANSSFGLLSVTESEAPVDQDESSEEEAISFQARTRFGGSQPSLPLLVPASGAFIAANVNVASLPHSGHRLANHLLAPLRC